VIVYGRNPVRELLAGRRAHQVEGIWASERVSGEPWLAAETVTPVSGDEIERLCDSAEHQGVCAEAGGYPYAGAAELLADTDALVVALDEVQDPHNLGAVCRVAESAGAAGVVIPERRAAEVTPAVCKASAGAVEHLRVARVRNLADWLGEAKAGDAWVYGAAADATVPYHRPDYRGRVVLVLGSEGSGLRPRVAAACDELVALPQRGRLGSLNVSAAASALLYGILQLRDPP
jgi:23S rRNA (guanosine2251-2'-O)-methyltransferase